MELSHAKKILSQKLKKIASCMESRERERERERERMRPSHYNTSATTYCSESLEEYHQKIANINRYLFEEEIRQWNQKIQLAHFLIAIEKHYYAILSFGLWLSQLNYRAYEYIKMIFKFFNFSLYLYTSTILPKKSSAPPS